MLRYGMRKGVKMRRKYTIRYNHQSCIVSGQQTVTQKDSIEALHENRDPLVQIASLSSLA